MRKSIIGLFVALNTTSVLADENKAQGFYVGADYVLYSADNSRKLQNAPLAQADDGDGVGFRLGYTYSELWDFRLSYSDIQVESSGTGSYDFDGSILTLDALYSPWEAPTFLSFGVSQLDMESKNEAFSIGAGLKQHLSERLAVTAEAKRYFGISDSLNSDVSLHFGIDYKFGETSSVAKTAPADGDRDGVVNSLDNCPNTVFGAPVNGSGCADSDRDGILDINDRCPNTARGTRVDGNGCKVVLDTDKDGVLDNVDACPNSISGATVDSRGCMVKAESIELEVLFAHDSSEVTAQYMTQLREVADYLARHPKVTLELGGHTSIVGSDTYNQGLSERRANAVKAILVEQLGVSSARIETVGYGESQPKHAGSSEQAHRKNRRIEATFSDQ